VATVRRKIRVRVIKDPRRYRRYKRRKLIRRLRRVALWGGLVILAAAVVWLILVFLYSYKSSGVEPEKGVNALGY
jgi:hypothetical protein